MAKSKKKKKRSPAPQKLQQSCSVRLSQCMIVKNEEKNIEKALSWGKGIVCEQIVVDTGSADRTIEIAERMGAKVYHFKWIDDFSAAKNFAIEQATGDWIAFLDADEYFTKNDAKKVIPYIKALESSLGKKYLTIACIMVALNDEGVAFSEIWHTRLFRNIPEVRYHGRIHEELTTDSPDIVKTTDFKIMHTGYSKSAFVETDKAQRNAEMLRVELALDPDNIKLKAYLAESLLAVVTHKLADKEMIDSMLREIDSLFKEVVRSDEFVEDVQRKAAYMFFLAQYTGNPGISDEYDELCEKAFNEYPDDEKIMSFQEKLISKRNFYKARQSAQEAPAPKPVNDNKQSARSQFENEAATFIKIVQGMIDTNQLSEAAELLDQYTLLNPTDPQINVLRSLIDEKIVGATNNRPQAEGIRDSTSTEEPTDTIAADNLGEYAFLSNIESIYVVNAIGQKKTGLYTSLYHKIKLIEERTGHRSIVFTCAHNIEQRMTEVWLKTFTDEQQIVSKNTTFINAYDYFQKSYAPGLKSKAVYERKEDALRSVKASDIRYDIFDGDTLVRQDIFTGFSGSLRMERHFDDGAVTKEICYDDWGYVNYVRNHTDDKSYTVNYMTTDGKLCLEAYYNKKDGGNELKKLLVYDDDGAVTATLSCHEELAALCLERMMCDNKRYMIVFEDGLTAKIAGMLDRKRGNIRTISVVHSIFLKDAYKLSSGPQKYFEYLCNNPRQFDGVVMLTEAARADFTKLYDMQDSTYVIPHPYPKEIVKANFESRDRRKAVIVARLFPEKQIDLAVDIFSRVVEALPDAMLEIYGRGTEKDALEEQIYSLGMEKNILLKGYTDDAYSIFSKAALSIFTSRAEGYGLTIMESICNGCPVFAIDIKYGPADIIKEGKTGYLFSSKVLSKATDTKPLTDVFAKRLIDFISDEKLQREMSENCYADTPRFSPDVFLERWLTMMKEIFNANGIRDKDSRQ